MLVGRGGPWPGQMRAYCSSLRGLGGRPPAGARAGGLRHRHSLPPTPGRPFPALHLDKRKGNAVVLLPGWPEAGNTDEMFCQGFVNAPTIVRGSSHK